MASSPRRAGSLGRDGSAPGTGTDPRHQALLKDLHTAVSFQNVSELSMTLERAGKEGYLDDAINQTHPTEGRTLLQLAVAANQPLCVQELRRARAGSKRGALAEEPADYPAVLSAAAHSWLMVEKMTQSYASQAWQNIRDKFGRDAMHIAAKYGRTEVIEKLVARTEQHLRSLSTPSFLLPDRIAEVFSKDSDGYTPLHYAAMCGHVEAMRKTLAHCQIDAETRLGHTPLHVAISRGAVGAATELLTRAKDLEALAPKTRKGKAARAGSEPEKLPGANVNARDATGLTPLFLAVRNADAELVKLLLANGADPNVRNGMGLNLVRFVIHIALAERKAAARIVHHAKKLFRARQAARLEEHKAKQRAWRRTDAADDDDGDAATATPKKKGGWFSGLCHKEEFVSESEEDHVQQELGKIDIRQPAVDAFLFADRAAALGRLAPHDPDGYHGCIPRQVQRLEQFNGRTWQQVRQARMEILSSLVEAGMDVDAPHEHGITPLYTAVENGLQELIEALVSHGADPGVAANDGSTPLFIAVETKRHKLVNFLVLVAKSDVNHQRRNGATPLHTAAALGDVDMCNLLVDLGASIEARNNGDWTPLFAAAHCGKAETAAVLLERGASRVAVDQYGCNAADVARTAGHSDVADCLSGMKPLPQVTVSDLGRKDRSIAGAEPSPPSSPTRTAQERLPSAAKPDDSGAGSNDGDDADGPADDKGAEKPAGGRRRCIVM